MDEKSFWAALKEGGQEAAATEATGDDEHEEAPQSRQQGKQGRQHDDNKVAPKKETLVQDVNFDQSQLDLTEPATLQMLTDATKMRICAFVDSVALNKLKLAHVRQAFEVPADIETTRQLCEYLYKHYRLLFDKQARLKGLRVGLKRWAGLTALGQYASWWNPLKHWRWAPVQGILAWQMNAFKNYFLTYTVAKFTDYTQTLFQPLGIDAATLGERLAAAKKKLQEKPYDMEARDMVRQGEQEKQVLDAWADYVLEVQTLGQPSANHSDSQPRPAREAFLFALKSAGVRDGEKLLASKDFDPTQLPQLDVNLMGNHWKDYLWWGVVGGAILLALGGAVGFLMKNGTMAERHKQQDSIIDEALQLDVDAYRRNHKKAVREGSKRKWSKRADRKAGGGSARKQRPSEPIQTPKSFIPDEDEGDSHPTRAPPEAKKKDVHQENQSEQEEEEEEDEGIGMDDDEEEEDEDEEDAWEDEDDRDVQGEATFFSKPEKKLEARQFWTDVKNLTHQREKEKLLKSLVRSFYSEYNTTNYADTYLKVAHVVDKSTLKRFLNMFGERNARKYSINSKAARFMRKMMAKAYGVFFPVPQELQTYAQLGRKPAKLNY